MISFGRCVCGYEPKPPTCDGHPWAVFAGYGDCLTFFDEDHPDGLAVAPARGSIVAVKLRYPFVATLGAPFWCTFDPVGAFRDGYDEYPDDLAGFRLLRARITIEPLYGSLRREAEARAEIIEVVEPDRLLSLAPTDHSLSRILKTLHYKSYHVRCNNLCYKNSNFEGDIISWSLVLQDDYRSTLLIFGQDGHHENHFYAGHRPLNTTEILQLC